MKCGIARVDNSGLSIVSSFLVAARLRATAAELRTQLITAHTEMERIRVSRKVATRKDY
jgi:hypothetical protein